MRSESENILRLCNLHYHIKVVAHHIEVVNEEFLMKLRNQKHLKYLRLSGISRISELPPSIFQFMFKACHNLETLLDDIASLRKFRHFDLSLLLLQRMTKGFKKLTDHRVLKGFVTGSSEKTHCRISNLAKFAIGALVQDGLFESKRELSKLDHLKISWGVSDIRYNDIQIILLSSL